MRPSVAILLASALTVVTGTVARAADEARPGANSAPRSFLVDASLRGSEGLIASPRLLTLEGQVATVEVGSRDLPRPMLFLEVDARRVTDSLTELQVRTEPRGQRRRLLVRPDQVRTLSLPGTEAAPRTLEVSARMLPPPHQQLGSELPAAL